MKCILLAENLKPDRTNADDLSKYPAKSAFEQNAKQLERREARSRETLLAERRHGRPATDEGPVVRQNVADRTATLGSEEFLHLYHGADCGLFSSVVAAYNKHWKLRTSPEDWWYVVARRVAIAIDQNSKREAVRKLFVEHEGTNKSRSIYLIRVPSSLVNWEFAVQFCTQIKVISFIQFIYSNALFDFHFKAKKHCR
jgi:hypothetical protein